MGKKSSKRPKSIWKNVRHLDDDDALDTIWEAIQNTKPNEPCWCDSRQKYKNCHLTRSQEAPLRIHEYITVLRKIYDKGYCLHPQAHSTVCVTPIIKAHSVQRNGGLSRIAKDGHVYTFASEKKVLRNSLWGDSLFTMAVVAE